MKFLFLFFIIIIGLIQINGECRLDFEPNSSPIFIPRVGNEFLQIYPDHINFGQYNYLTALCPSGFGSIKYIYQNQYYKNINDVEDNVQAMLLRCINGETKIQTTDGFHSLSSQLQCQTSDKSEIFEGSLNETCNKKLYTINLNNGNSSFNFADICFDSNNMHVDYLHYVTKQFDKPISYNQFTNNDELPYLTKTEAPAEIFFINENSLDHLIYDIIGYENDFLKFRYEEFYPRSYWFPQISDPLNKAKTLNRFLGWTNLIEGNWRLFRNLLENRSKNIIYDVYLGTSDVVVAPSYDNYNNLKELYLKEFYNKKITVPKYVWAYLKSREIDSDEFVVIGVNSPYFDFFPRNETIFCDDICDEINWFSSLEKFRKMSTFGYMFCCRKEQVENKLKGFPQISLSKPNIIPPVDNNDDDEFFNYA